MGNYNSDECLPFYWESNITMGFLEIRGVLLQHIIDLIFNRK